MALKYRLTQAVSERKQYSLVKLLEVGFWVVRSTTKPACYWLLLDLDPSEIAGANTTGRPSRVQLFFFLLIATGEQSPLYIALRVLSRLCTIRLSHLKTFPSLPIERNLLFQKLEYIDSRFNARVDRDFAHFIQEESNRVRFFC